jgi:hypothetical protein
MAKRIKKPPIKPEVRREWLKRNQEDGESPPQIATKDHYDVRTVRKQIELAKQEREVREARFEILKNALGEHYGDLRRFAEKLNSQITGIGEISYSLDDDLIESALKQHLPRSPIWNYLSKWQSLHERVQEERNRLESAIKNTVGNNSRLKSISSSGLDGVIPGVSDLLIFETKRWIDGDYGHSLADSLVIEPEGKGLVNPRFGFSHMGVMDKQQATQYIPIIQKAIGNLEEHSRKTQEYLDLEKTNAEIERVRSKLREELAVIRLKRILPGRCKYCPL